MTGNKEKKPSSNVAMYDVLVETIQKRKEIDKQTYRFLPDTAPFAISERIWKFLR